MKENVVSQNRYRIECICQLEQNSEDIRVWKSFYDNDRVNMCMFFPLVNQFA